MMWQAAPFNVKMCCSWAPVGPRVLLCMCCLFHSPWPVPMTMATFHVAGSGFTITPRRKQRQIQQNQDHMG